MKRILIVLLLCLFCLSSCERYIRSGRYPEVYGEIDPYDTEISPPDEPYYSTEYIVNTATKAYHLPSCHILKNVNDENIVSTTDILFLIERSYSPCKFCIKNSP